MQIDRHTRNRSDRDSTTEHLARLHCGSPHVTPRLDDTALPNHIATAHISTTPQIAPNSLRFEPLLDDTAHRVTSYRAISLRLATVLDDTTKRFAPRHNSARRQATSPRTSTERYIARLDVTLTTQNSSAHRISTSIHTHIAARQSDSTARRQPRRGVPAHASPPLSHRSPMSARTASPSLGDTVSGRPITLRTIGVRGTIALRPSFAISDRY